MSSRNGVPEDLRPRYLSLARSIQAAAMKQRGTAVVTIHVVVDAGGSPHYWTTPEVTKIEPANCGDKLIRLLASQEEIHEKV